MIEELSNAIIEVLENENLRRYLERNARETSKKIWDWSERMLEEVKEIQKLVNELNED